jgi:hypothetical protein
MKIPLMKQLGQTLQIHCLAVQSRSITGVLLAILLLPSASMGHGGHHHDHSQVTAPAPQANSEVRETYLHQIRPILIEKCGDCHSRMTRYPWYYKVPLIHQWLDQDIAEAREHLDISDDYPFRSHASPSEDLSAIEEITKNDKMPPLSYRLMHRGSSLTESEKQLILLWLQMARQHL